MAFAAFRPAPMAEMTVAEPITISPPAYTPSLLVLPFSGSAMMYFPLFPDRFPVLSAISGFAPVPTAMITTSAGIANSEPVKGFGVHEPDALRLRVVSKDRQKLSKKKFYETLLLSPYQAPSHHISHTKSFTPYSLRW
jgi:hypothetical protein